ncbi:glycosyltransferase family 2 protein [Campylobacter sp. CNRCH_2014_2452]|uniref:glycosyltransferase family 2 protein n=1 Tax=Campylobacter sp. CNRCH_2014_2452 TaxID=2911603 RepID=UPI00126F97BC|nr:glycosyltransferase family 2 protein [Campylobacter sp. CNRCH_2014_2452]EAK0817865.1 glycosyltransferase family 2 protein [Campylobacter lari]EAK9890886.1 glycosyltransferase family 2 protein [Campylobacter lari]EGK8026211.1 glycosyltransferase family 2 protein [Campylobacter lari]EGK8093111.1 glycosyltransferase family 2 protein [Campylobacter lari]EID4797173.1 glycosyltransferase family 2 protein [Campylobacter lari]
MSQISIILPTYNVEKYIARALESCINQTFKDIEIIVVDDCGNDKSVDIAKEYASKDDRIKIIHNEENLGTFASRNIGVLNAKSDFIMFLDPDDYLELNACEICIKNLDYDDDLLCFNFISINPNQLKKDKFFIKNSFSIEFFFNFFLQKYPYYNWYIWGKVYKKITFLKIFEKLPLKSKEKIIMGEDALTFLAYLFFSKHIKTLDDNLYYYDLTNDNSSTNIQSKEPNLKYFESINYVIKKIHLFSLMHSNQYKFHCKIFIYNLKINKAQSLKISEKNIFKKIQYTCQRKIIKLKRDFLIHKAKLIMFKKG